jgi:hypothetical protein
MAKSLYAKKTYLGAGSSIFISQMIINNLCAAIADKTIHKIVLIKIFTCKTSHIIQ